MIDAARGASAARITVVMPVLRLRPLRQEGRAAHLDRRAAGRRPAGHRRRRPRADHGAARAAGARLLQRALSTTCTPCTSWPTTSAAAAIFPTPSWWRRTWATPSQAAAFARRLGLPVAVGAKQRISDTKVVISAHHRRDRRQGRDRHRRRDRRRLDRDRAAGAPARPRRRRRCGSPAPTACSAATRLQRLADRARGGRDRDHEHRPDRAGEAHRQAHRALGRPGAGRSDAPHPRRRVRRASSSTSADRHGGPSSCPESVKSPLTAARERSRSGCW